MIPRLFGPIFPNAWRLVFIALIIFGSTGHALVVGDSVQASATLNIRDAAAGSYLDQAVSGDRGVIIAGPTQAVYGGTNYTWWRVDWDNRLTGWSIEGGLAKVVGNAPGAFTLTAETPYWDTSPPPGPAVKLNWILSSGAISYDVYRNGSSYFTGITGLTFLNLSNLVGGQTYSYHLLKLKRLRSFRHSV